ncbi:hypothetical protein Ddye_015428 [Dipteronia dyeriana]|uniref:Leucine-rich repeat-containing N-terminal plant-type domain-containing protein n=1 Tax=Dipteronia dyeriana TaxID=168575 RepID=A0AAD9WXW3_9ROSI|nr:hypothetical protein Ddye_015428 [Dipteronia dyeriana]
MGSSSSFFTFMYLSFLLFSFQLTSSRQPPCHDKEHSALLRFKESLSIEKFASGDPSAYSKTGLWNLEGNGDCCSWDGVECDEETGYVIKLDLSSSCLYGSINSTSTLFHLVHLQWLSLADNDFNFSKIPSGIMNLSSLLHLNLSDSHFSGQIPPEMLQLSKLESLDLSGYYQLQLQQLDLKSLVEKLTNLKVLDLSGVNISSSLLPEVLTNLSSLEFLSLRYCNLEGTISSSLHKLYNLIHLDLSVNHFWGQIPSEMLELSQLEYLDLSRNEDSEGHPLLQLRRPGGLRSLVDKLTNLKWLDLDGVNISSSIPNSLGNLSSLTHLSLYGCNLQGTIPSSIGSLTKLVHLDISYNNFWGELPTSIANLGSLQVLDLSINRLSGQTLSSLNNLTRLDTLKLSYNNFSSGNSSSWSWIAKQTKLTLLSLSGVNLAGEIPFCLLNLTHLSHLDMGYNQLTGSIPFWLMNLNRLSSLNFGSNLLIGQIPSDISNLTQLNHLDLSSNQLQGPIPSSFLGLNNLNTLDLSSNNLSGTKELEMFLQLKSLRSLYLSSNRLSLLSNFTVNTSSHKFQNLSLGSSKLDQLDLSSNNISGKIPGWLFNLSLAYLNLSHNLLTAFDQQPTVLPLMLDLSFNKLQGPLPISSISTVVYYIVSNNNLSGELSPLICYQNSLQVLDLSNNSLSGKLPQCLGNFSYSLSMINLQNNKFRGSIPQTFMDGTKLRMIDLSNNMLEGKIPRSLANCTMLEFLDLGNNKINDTFPSWIGNLPNLVVFNLQSNKLYGAIEEPKSDFEFPKLQIIDLSNNRFTGKLPSKYFECWNAMKVVDASQLAYMMKSTSDYGVYDYSLRMINKGIEIEYVMISNMLVSIYLSNNRFEGEIPSSISILQGLRYLNLSNNRLIGSIPPSLANLTVLESLDLSNNSLSGQIPPQLVKLTPLASFNVSYNNFTGPIPHGAQFDTFDNMSYEGNPRLCGPPLSRKCGNSELPQKADDEGSESPFAFGWKVVAIGYASGLIIGVVLGHVFCTRKYEWFVKIFGMPLKKIERKMGRRRDTK